jgi:hypothetical protein
MKPTTIFPAGILVVSLCTIALAMPIPGHVSELDFPSDKGAFELEKRSVVCPVPAACELHAEPVKRNTVRYRPGNNRPSNRSVDDDSGSNLGQLKPAKRSESDDSHNDGSVDDIKMKGAAPERSTTDDWNAPGNDPPESGSDDWNSPGAKKRSSDPCPGTACNLPKKLEKRPTGCQGSDCAVGPKSKDIGKGFWDESMY